MPGIGSEPTRRPRIAVIDGEPLVVKSLVRMLSQLVPAAECKSAHDGFSAGALVVAFRPDLVFLDIFMPGLSGIDACAHIRSRHELRGTSVVIVSAHLSAGVRTRLAAAGADRIIAEPFGRADIEAAVAELLSSRFAVRPAAAGA